MVASGFTGEKVVEIGIGSVNHYFYTKKEVVFFFTVERLQLALLRVLLFKKFAIFFSV